MSIPSVSVPCLGSTCFPNGEITNNIAILGILTIPGPCGECYSNKIITSGGPNGQDFVDLDGDGLFDQDMDELLN